MQQNMSQTPLATKIISLTPTEENLFIPACMHKTNVYINSCKKKMGVYSILANLLIFGTIKYIEKGSMNISS